MSHKEILQLGNPILWQESKPIEDIHSADTSALINDLSDTLAAFRSQHGFGRAIAAPQIGVNKRMIFVRMQPSGFCGPLINPVIVWEDPLRMELWDDCFSFPDLMVRVSRAVQIRVEYRDEHAQRQSIDVDGDLSELLQHEIDHLDGILAVQRAVSPRALATRTQWVKMMEK